MFFNLRIRKGNNWTFSVWKLNRWLVLDYTKEGEEGLKDVTLHILYNVGKGSRKIGELGVYTIVVGYKSQVTWSLPVGPCKSHETAPNNMRAKFTWSVNSYLRGVIVTSHWIYVAGAVQRQAASEAAAVSGENRAFAWKCMGWLETLENLQGYRLLTRRYTVRKQWTTRESADTLDAFTSPYNHILAHSCQWGTRQKCCYKLPLNYWRFCFLIKKALLSWNFFF